MKKAIFALSLILIIQGASPSSARDVGSNVHAFNLTSGQWSIVAFGQGQVPTNSAYTITWTVNTGTAYNFFSFRNTGSYTATGFVVDVTQVQVGGSGKPNNTTFDLCQNGVWNSTTNTCSGTKVTVGTATDLSSTLTFTGLSLASGADLSMRASTPPNIKNIYTTTLSVSINRSEIRSGVVVNS